MQIYIRKWVFWHVPQESPHYIMQFREIRVFYGNCMLGTGVQKTVKQVISFLLIHSIDMVSKGQRLIYHIGPVFGPLWSAVLVKQTSADLAHVPCWQYSGTFWTWEIVGKSLSPWDYRFYPGLHWDWLEWDLTGSVWSSLLSGSQCSPVKTVWEKRIAYIWILEK